jgi:GTP-binding protein
VLFKEENCKKFEPVEEVIIDVGEEFSGIIMDKLSFRKGEMIDMRPSGNSRVRLTFLAP